MGNRLSTVTLYVALAAVVVLVPAGAGAASEAVYRGESGEQHGEEAADHGEHGSHGFHRNHIALFVGVTEDEHHSAFSLGLDYERRLTQLFGVGVLIDFAGGNVRSGLWGIPFFLHPGGSWTFVLAPGRENGTDRDAEFMLRAGVLYDFEVGTWTITPNFNVDFVGDEEVYVYGFNVGKGW